MFRLIDKPVTSVTSAKDEICNDDPFDFLSLEPRSKAQSASDAAADAAREQLQALSKKELEFQSQLEFAASAEKVRELLGAAKTGGMTQRDFEVLTARLRPGRVETTERSNGWNGVLWHHYYVRGARMSLVSFRELVCQLAENKWISTEQREQFDTYAWTKENGVTNARELKTPITRWEERRRHAQLLEDIGLHSFDDSVRA